MSSAPSIPLDRLHVVHRDGDRWLLQKKTPEGALDLERWQGPVASLRKRLEKFGIVPDRRAEELIGNLGEASGFRDRSEE